MFFRIPRLTPGYIRYLQTQAAQTVLQSREGPAMPRMALLMGLMGIGMSGYSSRQLTLERQLSVFVLNMADVALEPQFVLMSRALSWEYSGFNLKYILNASLKKPLKKRS
uniref:Uncharacterized protein n=1 Tax=Echeneis naucrates TaxID=173247 RepID=A0A665WVB0_ECHNA